MAPRGMRARAGRPEGEEAAGKGRARKAPEAQKSARRARAELSGKDRADARKQKIGMFRSGLDSTGGRQRRSCRRTLPDACPRRLPVPDEFRCSVGTLPKFLVSGEETIAARQKMSSAGDFLPALDRRRPRGYRPHWNKPCEVVMSGAAAISPRFRSLSPSAPARGGVAAGGSFGMASSSCAWWRRFLRVKGVARA